MRNISQIIIKLKLKISDIALIIEFIGYKTKDKKYDKLAYEFTKLLSVSFSLTATLGALLTFALVILYPKLTQYLIGIFSWTFFPYVLLFGFINQFVKLILEQCIR